MDIEEQIENEKHLWEPCSGRFPCDSCKENMGIISKLFFEMGVLITICVCIDCFAKGLYWMFNEIFKDISGD